VINRIELNGISAKQVIATLCREYPWKFTEITDNDATYCFTFFDEYGYEYSRSIYLRATKNDKAILVYINKKEFPRFAREYDLDTDITALIVDYINDAFPNAISFIR